MLSEEERFLEAERCAIASLLTQLGNTVLLARSSSLGEDGKPPRPVTVNELPRFARQPWAISRVVSTILTGNSINPEQVLDFGQREE